jgi:hypothetical protein
MIHRVGPIRSDFHLEHGVGTAPADPLDPNPNIGQVLRQSPVVNREIDKVANPMGR